MSTARSERDSEERPAAKPSLWFRVLLHGGALGPGKLDLMRRIDDTGSVSAAARGMRMSHARSVKLVAEVNALGGEPLIETRTGGEAGGGARLTDRGRAVLSAYDALETDLARAAGPHLSAIERELARG
jgi:molybdate transport system regulatory protein